MSDGELSGFSRIRSFLWPIHQHELKKFLPMLVIFFLISLNYNTLRTLKDTIVVTAPQSGAEIIPFIKLWIMLPTALLMTYLYTKLSGNLAQEKVFYVIVSVFITYFLLFAWVLYPMRESLHLHGLADRLALILPSGAKGLVAMIRYWSFSLFYAMSEVWGNIVLFLLFWGFANEVTRIGEAKRFYGLFGLGANLSGIVAGKISIECSQAPFNPWLPFGSTAWEQSLMKLVLIVFISGLATMLIFRWVHKSVITDARYYCQEKASKQKNERQRLSIKESMACLAKTPYLRNIATIVLSYNLVINLVEVIWKHEVRLLYPNPGEFQVYMSQVNICIGIISTFTALFVAGNLIRLWGWTATALITPIILAITSVGFFSFIFFESTLTPLASSLSVSTLAVVVFFGSLQNVLSRGAKYTVFDATKELSFIPLSRDERIKGKTIIDGVGTRLGKSGGSLIHQTLLFMFGTVSACAPYIAAILFALIGFWTSAVVGLGQRFNELTQGYLADNAQKEKSSDSLASKEAINI